MVFQDPAGSLNPRMTAGAAVGEALRVHGRAKNRAEAREMAAEWLETVGLDAGYLDRYPHEMSGGQRQRVNLARALCTGAEFLVADEPVSALDVSVQAQILNLLKRLQRERGITWVLIGHDLAVLRQMADRVVVMYAGQCVEEAPLKELMEHPAHCYTRALMRAVPGLHDDRSRWLYSISGFVPQEYGEIQGCRFAQRCPHGAGCPERDEDRMYEIAPGHFSRCLWEGGGMRDG